MSYAAFPSATVAALLHIEELCRRVLGDPDDPDSVCHAFGDKSATALPVGAVVAIRCGYHATDVWSPGALIPRAAVLKFVTYLALSRLPFGR